MPGAPKETLSKINMKGFLFNNILLNPGNPGFFIFS
jgi:hypothetical protein